MCLVNCILSCHYVVAFYFILHIINVCCYLSPRAGSLLSDKSCYLFSKNCGLLMIYRAAFCLMVHSGFVHLFISENQEALYLMRKPVLELIGGFWWLRHHAELCGTLFVPGTTSTAILHSASLPFVQLLPWSESHRDSDVVCLFGHSGNDQRGYTCTCTAMDAWGTEGGGGVCRTAPGIALVSAHAASAPADSSLFLVGPLY